MPNNCPERSGQQAQYTPTGGECKFSITVPPPRFLLTNRRVTITVSVMTIVAARAARNAKRGRSAWSRKPRRCRWKECARWFVPRHHLQRYHSPKCANVARNRVYRRRQKKAMDMLRAMEAIEARERGEREERERRRAEMIEANAVVLVRNPVPGMLP